MVLPALLVHLESAVQLAQLGPLVCLDVLVLRDLQDLLERKADRERKDLKVQLDAMAFKDLWACQDLEDLPDHPERMETKERLENLDRKEAKEIRENMVHQDQLALKDLSEHPVLLELMESLVPEVSRVSLGRRETKGQEDFPDPLVLLDFRACQDHLVRKVKLEMLVKWDHLVPLEQEAPQDRLVLTALKDLLVVLATLVL